ncbi:unnamed protein product [Moneuplotes crassus]|uniref:Uncharacterized protein n=1 Tax=Euplotes crassus TaxID=5936 RepID=A0AAD2D6A6_EUPCR|nr:unnamed protein product [Moneuplotes crassus]
MKPYGSFIVIPCIYPKISSSNCKTGTVFNASGSNLAVAFFLCHIFGNNPFILILKQFLLSFF